MDIGVCKEQRANWRVQCTGVSGWPLVQLYCFYCLYCLCFFFPVNNSKTDILSNPSSCDDRRQAQVHSPLHTNQPKTYLSWFKDGSGTTTTAAPPQPVGFLATGQGTFTAAANKHSLGKNRLHMAQIQRHMHVIQPPEL